jgi:hypothetical protein
MAAITRLVAAWGYAGRLGGSFAGKAETETVTGGADYAVQSAGRGRKRRYFIELDGRTVYGRRADLVQMLQARGVPKVATTRPAFKVPPAPIAAKTASVPVPDLQPVDLTAYRAAKAAVELAETQQRNAAIALLLLT